jgi:hypothetical protein
VCAPEEDQPKGKNNKFFSLSICPSSGGSSKKEKEKKKKKKKNHSWQAFPPTEDHLFTQEDNQKSRKKKVDKSTRRLRF